MAKKRRTKSAKQSDSLFEKHPNLELLISVFGASVIVFFITYSAIH